MANPTTFVRQEFFLRRALRKLEAAEPLSPLLSVLLGQQKPSVEKRSGATPLQLIDENLNDSQRKAVNFALDSQEVALIWGPPGTGASSRGSSLVGRGEWIDKFGPQARPRRSSRSSANVSAPNRVCSCAEHPTWPSTTFSRGYPSLIQIFPKRYR